MSKSLLFVAVVALFLSFFRLGSVTLFDVDEAVFSEATKEMVQSGDWITPTYNGENRYDKPILFYWLMAASYKVFGINEFGARFPSALSAVLLVVSVFFFAGRIGDTKAATYTAVPLVVSPYFLIYSHAAVTDMALTLFISLSLFSLYLSVAPGNARTAGASASEKPNAYIYGFYLFSALAFLTKGLIGILFPFGVAIVFLLSTGGFRAVRKVFHLKGVLLFIVVAAPWYLAQLATNGREFIEQFFIKHHFRRYTGVISGHKGPVFYYLLTLLVGLIPWIVFLPGGIRKALDDRKRFRVRNSWSPDAEHIQPSDSPYSSLNMFALVWLAFIFIFFSLSTTKLPNYILPALPAVSILICAGMHEERWLRYGNIFMAILLLAAGIGLLFSIKYLSKFGLTETDWILPTALVLFAIAATGFYSAFSRKKCYGALSLFMAALLVLLSVNAVPVASNLLQGTLHRYSLYAKERLHADEKIITFGINYPSIVFYSDRRIIRVGNKNELMPLLTQGKRALIISKAQEIAMLQELGFTLLETDRKYAILEKQ